MTVAILIITVHDDRQVKITVELLRGTTGNGVVQSPESERIKMAEGTREVISARGVSSWPSYASSCTVR